MQLEMDFCTFVVLLLHIFGSKEIIRAFEITDDAALNGDSWQSSTYNESTVSSLAVDGDTSIVNCAQTNYEENPWWTVDLGALTYVYKITVLYGGSVTALSGLQVTFTTNRPTVSNPPSLLPTHPSVNQSLLPGLFPSPVNGTEDPPFVATSISLTAALLSPPVRYAVVRLVTKNDSLRLCDVNVEPNRIRGSVWSASHGLRMSVCIDSSSFSSSVVECGLRCLLNINCLSFNYRPTDGVCQLISCQPGSDVGWNYVIEDAAFAWYNKLFYWRTL